MKVKVYVKCVQPTQNEEYLHELLTGHQEDLAHAYTEMEKLIQENKDLRVEVSHLKDELDSMRAKIATVCAERDNWEASFKQMSSWWEGAIAAKNKAENQVSTLREQLNMSEARVNELDLRNQYLEDQAAVHHEEKEAFEDALRGFEEMRQEYQKELAEAHAEKRGWMNKFTELEEQKKRDDKKSEETCTACNEIYEKVLAERNQARAEVARLTEERDTAVSENTQMIFELEECRDQLTSAHKRIEEQQRIIEDASETITNLRRLPNSNVWNVIHAGLTEMMEEIEKFEAEH